MDQDNSGSAVYAYSTAFQVERSELSFSAMITVFLYNS